MTKPVATMTEVEARQAFALACSIYMNTSVGIEAPAPTIAKWNAARELRNDIFRRFGEQVLDWRRY